MTLPPDRRNAMDDQFIGIHWNGIDTYSLEWTAGWIGLVSIALESIAYQCNLSLAKAPSRHPSRERDRRVRGWFHYNSGKATNHPEVRTMPKCAFCGAELEPPVRVPHTVYVKKLYRVAGQDYCRHHVIRAAVAAGVITEIRAGAGPAVVVSR